MAFTMIELMVVLVIIGLMAAIAVPSFMRSMADTRLESSATRLLLDIKSVKLEASRTRTRHFIRFPSYNLKTWLVQAGPDDSTSWGSANSATKLVLQRTDSLEAGVSFGTTGKKVDSLKVPGSGVTTGPSLAFMAPSGDTAAKDDCTDGLSRRAPPAYNNKGWAAPSGLGAGLIVACGGPLSDLSLGVLYLSANHSDNVFAISYNHLGGLSNQVHLYKFDSKTWREVQ